VIVIFAGPTIVYSVVASPVLPTVPLFELTLNLSGGI
jgi:hypothetical protein